jgi:hypothetical protein
VVNWPEGLGGGFGGGGGTIGSSAGLLGKLGLLASAGALGYGLGTVINEKFEISDKVADRLFQLLHPPSKKDREETEKWAKDRGVVTRKRSRIENADWTDRPDGVAGPALESGAFYGNVPMLSAPPDWWRKEPNIEVVINKVIVDKDGNAHVETEKGTRHPKVMVRRGGRHGG